MGRPRLHRILVAASIAMALAVLLYLFFSGGPAPFPTDGELEVRAPVLRIPSAGCYEDEQYRVLIVVGDEISDIIEARFNWDPAKGVARVQTFTDASLNQPRPEPSTVTKLLGSLGLVSPQKQASPAFVIASPPEAPFPGRTLRRVSGHGRVYLGGYDADGELCAVPFQAHPEACFQLTRLGANVTPRDLANAAGLVMELRITREGDRVRYRWGPSVYSTEPRFSFGDTSFPADEVAASGKGPLLADLADQIRRGGGAGTPKVIFIAAGTGVRTVDYLRAVECGNGDPLVFFMPDPMSIFPPGNSRPPRPPTEAADVLIEGVDPFRLPSRTTTVRVNENGIPHIRGVRYDLETLREHIAVSSSKSVAIRSHRDALWSAGFPTLKAFLDAGIDLYFVMAPLDPVLGFMSALHLPRASEGEAPVEVTLVHGEKGIVAPTEGVAGKSVLVRIPADAKMEETLHALIRLKQAGATGFEFE